MAKLFVSYSRRDSTAARKLIDAFRSMGQEVWVDWESIPPAVDWLEQIFRGIEESDAFLFLISPDSIASEVCKVEINKAAQNNKRIIPVVLRDVSPKDAPENIGKLNWTFLRETDSFEEGMAKVKTAIELDLDWLEEHRRLQVRSLEWHRKKDTSLLLRGRDLRNARHMLATATAKDPTPTDLQKTFIQYSQRNERTRNIAVLAGTVALVIMAVLAYTAWQQSLLANRNAEEAIKQEAIAVQKAEEAEKAREEEERQRQIAEQARDEEERQRQMAVQNEVEAKAQRSAARAQIYQSRPGELYTSTLLAIDSMRRDPSAEAEEILRRNLLLLPRPVAQFTQARSITALTFNRDRSSFATASADGTVCTWQIQDRVSELFCTPFDRPPANAAAFNADGSLIAIGDQSGLLQVMDSRTGEVLHVYQRVEPVNSTIALVDLKSENLPDSYTPLDPPIPVRLISFHPRNPQLIAVAYEDGEIPFFNVNTGNVSSPLYTGYRPNVMGFNPNGNWLVVGSEPGNVSVWNLSSPEQFPAFAHRGGVLALAFSPKDNTIATGGNDNTAVISLSLKKQLFRIPNQNLIRDLAFSPDGSRLVTASADRRIRVWDTLEAAELAAMSQEGSVNEVVYSANGQWLATTGDDHTVRVWDAETGAQLFQIPLKATGSQLAFCNDDQWLVSTDESGSINVWDISIMETPSLSMSTPTASLVDHMQYSPSGEQIAVSSENNLWLLNTDPETILREREFPERSIPFPSKIMKLVFSPDSTWLAVLTESNEAAIYNVERRVSTPLQTAAQIRDLAFTPDSQQLVLSDTEGKLQVWDILKAQWVESPALVSEPVLSLASSSKFVAMGSATTINISGPDVNGGFDPLETSGENVLIVSNHDGLLLASTDSQGRINTWRYQNGAFTAISSFEKERAVSLAIHPNQELLAVGTTTYVYLMDIEGKELARLPQTDTVNDVSFSADGTYLATASSTQLDIWNIGDLQLINSQELVPAACSRLFENLSEGQWETLFPGEQYHALCEGVE